MDSVGKLLFEIDIYLFYLINDLIKNAFFDWLMPLASGLKYWLPIYAIGLYKLIRAKKWQTLVICFVIILIVYLADQISATYIKPWIDRARPCHTFDNINLLVNCGSGRSFPSAHSTNNFAVATFLAGIFPRKKWLWFSLASLVAISRVYNGVHYPIDIAGGAALGATIGWMIFILYDWSEKRFFKKNDQTV